MRASGDQQILLAHRFVRALDLTLLEAGDDLSLKEVCSILLILLRIQCSQSHKALDPRHVGMMVAIKPGQKTTHTLQASILALIPALPVPREFSAAWISVIPSVYDLFLTWRLS